MNTSDFEKVQLVPKKSQVTPPENECKLVRINEIEAGETTSTTSPSLIKSLEEFSFLDTSPDTHVPSSSLYLPSRPAMAGLTPRTILVERISTVLASSAFSKQFQSVSPLHETGIINENSTENRSPRSHSDTNVTAITAASPIIIRTSCLTDENSAEIVHPTGNIQLPSTHLAVKVKDQGLSASLDNLQDANFFLALENSPKISNNDLLIPTTSLKKPCIFRTVSESTEVGSMCPAELKRLGEEVTVFRGSKPQYHCCCRDEIPLNLKVGSPCGRYACRNGICSCRKHAVSVANLPSLRKIRRTPGLDEISYDFMRASGAISGKILGHAFPFRP
ncbi:hypothetical protein Aperf_G00000070254 [Anoplocephala perfoliata]